MPRVSPASRLAIAAALALLASGCASDQPQPRHRHWSEGGGRRPHGPSLFVSPAGEPFRAGPDAPYPVAAWFAQADANHDGRLSRAEFRADAERYFHRLDLNGDGVIDGSEVTAYEHNVLPEILATAASPGGGGGGGGGSQGGQGGWGGGRHGGHRHGGGGQGSSHAGAGLGLAGAAPYTLNRQAEPVSSTDANFDGRITLAEFLAAADRHFDALDTAGAGFLTLDGLPKTVVQERSQRRRPDHD